ncbi:MAG: GNAT family N-acetyltransferase [Nitrospiraceae bacterium]
MIDIIEAKTPAEFAAGRTLIEEYASTLGLDLCFQNFGQELSTLLIMYGPPDGCLLRARTEGDFLGCVAIRRLDNQICEMKRLYLRREDRGSGLGRRLVEAALEWTRRQRYRRMVLDTLPSMVAAQTLYKSLGFRRITPYYPNPIEGARYLALDLATT